YEALPIFPISLDFRFQPSQETLLKLEHILHVHVADLFVSCRNVRRNDQNIFEFVAAGRKDGSALVDLAGIKQVQNGNVLDGKDFIHALQAQTAFPIEKVGDVGLPEAGLASKLKSG